jgi:hypothetical protein
LVVVRKLRGVGEDADAIQYDHRGKQQGRNDDYERSTYPATIGEGSEKRIRNLSAVHRIKRGFSKGFSKTK